MSNNIPPSNIPNNIETKDLSNSQIRSIFINAAYICKKMKYDPEVFQAAIDNMYALNGVHSIKLAWYGNDYIDSLWPDDVTTTDDTNNDTASPISAPFSFNDSITVLENYVF